MRHDRRRIGAARCGSAAAKLLSRRERMKIKFPMLGLFGLCLLASARAQLYSVTDLGTLGGTYSSANAINSGGIVVGGANLTGDTAGHAFSYSGGVMTDLGTLGGNQSSAAGI